MFNIYFTHVCVSSSIFTLQISSNYLTSVSNYKFYYSCIKSTAVNVTPFWRW